MIAEVQEYLNTVRLDKSRETVASYEIAIRKFCDFMKATTFKALKNTTSSDCRKFQVYLAGTGIKKSSVNQYIRALKVFFNYLVNIDEITSSPLEKVKALKTTRENLTYLTEEEQSLLLDACEKLEDKMILATMLSLGLRRTELVNLKVKDIAANKVMILGKGNKYRSVFFPPDVFELYQEYMKVRDHKDSEYVFVSNRNKPYVPESIYMKVKRLAALAGFSEERAEKIACHTFRRTFATNLVSNNVSPQIIQGALGHANIVTTMKYANLRNSAVETAMEAQKPILKGK